MVKWTYSRIQEYVQRVRKVVLREGCRKCKRLVPSLELAGTPGLTRLARDGYGIERIKEAGKGRGWFCRSCARGINRKQALERLTASSSASTTLKSRGDFPPGEEGTRLYGHYAFQNYPAPKGHEYDPTSVNGLAAWREIVPKPA